MRSPSIIFTPRPDATLESEAVALAAVYRFVIEVASKREKAAEISGAKAAEGESKHEFRTAPTNPR